MLNTLIIGAGQAGLAVSRRLQERDIPHAVLERGRVGNTWREQRWDSFRLNTPNLVNVLPGDSYEGDDPHGFARASDLVAYFEDYAERHSLPIEEGVEVTAVRPKDGGFEVEANGERRTCRNVVLCCGDQNRPRVPAVADELPDDVVQVHTAQYRAPSELPDGAVLVVGTAQSGVQIAEDLLEADREVFVSTSAVGRIPRRYRGKDIFAWLELAGLTEQRPEDLEDPNEIHERQGQISGTHGGHTVSLHQLARDGATLLGRLEAVRGRTLAFADDLADNVRKGDEASAKIRGGVDLLIEKTGMDAPPAEPDPAEAPFDGIEEMARVRELDLDRSGVRSVVWATGFGPRLDFLDPALLDESGRPRQREGIGEVPGLYCVGFVWLRRRASGLLPGVAADAEHVAEHIASRRSP